jgi:hypothetical protein
MNENRVRFKLPTETVTRLRETFEKNGFVITNEHATFNTTGDLTIVLLPQDWRADSYMVFDNCNRYRFRTDVSHGDVVIIWNCAINIEEFTSYYDSDRDYWEGYLTIIYRGHSTMTSSLLSRRPNTGMVESTKANREQALEPDRKTLIAWLDTNLPDWKSPFAYWD